MSFSCPFCSTQRKDIYAHIDSYHQDISLDKKIELSFKYLTDLSEWFAEQWTFKYFTDDWKKGKYHFDCLNYLHKG